MPSNNGNKRLPADAIQLSRAQQAGFEVRRCNSNRLKKTHQAQVIPQRFTDWPIMQLDTVESRIDVWIVAGHV
jgi:hypothetical protein